MKSFKLENNDYTVYEEEFYLFRPEQSWEDLKILIDLIQQRKKVLLLSPKIPEDVISEYIPQIEYRRISDKLFSLYPTNPFLIENYKERPLLVFTSSGSSGPIKYIVHDLKSLIENAKSVNQYFQTTEESSWQLCLPLYHVAGFSVALRAYLSQSPLHFRAYDETLEEITHLSIVPTMLYRILEDPKLIEKFKGKKLFVGGAKLNSELYDEALKHDLEIFQSYGMTELGSTVAIRSPGSSGHDVLTPHEVQLGENNNILIRSSTMALGELNMESQVLYQIVDDHGLLHTNDIGFLNQDNTLTVKGRDDLTYITGGENITPFEIEQVLLRHLNLAKTAVIAMDDEEYGQIGVLALGEKDLSPSQSLKGIVKELQRYIPKYKIPKKIVTVPDYFFSNLKPARAKLKEFLKERTELWT